MYFGTLQTRRQLLKKGALALGGLAAAELAGVRWLLGGTGANAAGLSRCVSLGANGVINPGSTQDYRNARAFLLETGTSWVRIWADWPSLQPEGGLAPDQGSGAWRVAELDKQIAQANTDGINVMLVSYRFPTWANGTSGLSPAADAAYQPQDRIPPGGNPASRKDLRFKLPADLGPTSAWGRWIAFLVNRYSWTSIRRRATIAALEVCNEPNLQMWPLEGPSTTRDPYSPGPVTVQRAVAQMFKTAQSITAVYGSTPMLVGPATWDGVGHSRLKLGYETFTRALLDELDRVGFHAGAQFAWSHHNYTDVEYDRGADSLTLRTVNRAVAARQMLVGRWAGWPAADAAAPSILLPEGGARLTKIARVYRTSDPTEIRVRQAELIERNWNRMTGGLGIAMVGQYLLHTDPNFDSGLCEVDGSERPAYFTWAGLPSEVGAKSERR